MDWERYSGEQGTWVIVKAVGTEDAVGIEVLKEVITARRKEPFVMFNSSIDNG